MSEFSTKAVVSYSTPPSPITLDELSLLIRTNYNNEISIMTSNGKYLNLEFLLKFLDDLSARISENNIETISSELEEIKDENSYLRQKIDELEMLIKEN